MTLIDKPRAAAPDARALQTGACWIDSSGQRTIQAHGGGMLFHDGAYYWYGENRNTPTHVPGAARKVLAVGVSCYRSTDLLTWEDLGLVLPAVQDDPDHDLHVTKVIERPKVIYNASTRQFVMWLHVDSPDYAAARAGVAVADDPAGPFRYVRSIRPNGFMSRDQTVFRDDDGRAYHFAASDENATTMISLLTDDYLDVSGKFTKVFPGRYMEAGAVCKRDGRYWLLASGCSGWAPNEARSAVTDDLLGDWQETGNPCAGDAAGAPGGPELTFGGQSAFIIPPARDLQPYVAMFDIWRPGDLRTSGYMWLPIDFSGGRMQIRYRQTWDNQP